MSVQHTCDKDRRDSEYCLCERCMDSLLQQEYDKGYNQALKDNE